jgi:hypothetical protein
MKNLKDKMKKDDRVFPVAEELRLDVVLVANFRLAGG